MTTFSTRSARALGAVLALPLALGLVAGCSSASESDDGPLGQSEQFAQPIDRLLIGKAAKYPADTSLRVRAPVFEASMAERRKMAWSIVERVFTPVKIAARAPTATHPSTISLPTTSIATAHLELPRFQTWYSKDDVLPMFDRLFRALSDSDKTTRSPFTDKAVADVFPWNAKMATSLESFTQERLDARKQELATALGVHSLGKDTRVLMSPDYVSHLLKSYNQILDCQSSGNAQLNDANNFAPCLKGEFPPAAVAVKARWMPSSSPIPTYDTSASSLATKLANGTFGSGDGQANPDETSAYSMQLTSDTTMRLVALHIMTKELRDWSWITLWWSPDADADFGSDRPSSLSGPFAHYKMCVVTAYGEKDAAPGASFSPTLKASLGAISAEGPATWCSNPYLETPARAAKTNCIGCHQQGGSGETTSTILADPTRFPDFSRTKIRASFPSDYAFTTDGGLDLAAEMRARVDALTPP